MSLIRVAGWRRRATARGGGVLRPRALCAALAAVFSSSALAPVWAQTVNTRSVSTQNIFGVHQIALGNFYRNEGSINSFVNNARSAITTRAATSYVLDNAGTIGTLTNRGVMNGGLAGVGNTGVLRTINNLLTITGQTHGVFNGSGASLSLFDNRDAAVLAGSTGAAFANLGSVGTLNNSGVIRPGGTLAAIVNGESGTLGLLRNSATGAMYGGAGGAVLDNRGAVGTLSNAGLMTGGGAQGVVSNAAGASVGVLDNAGVLSAGADGAAVHNAGVMGRLVNSGVISGAGARGAVYNAAGATLGMIDNSGTIAGAIRNLSSSPLTINGAGGLSYGTLTGISDAGGGNAGIGQIDSRSADLVFGSGNLLLRDHIDAGANAVVNAGSVLTLVDAITINGSYAQASNAVLQIVAIGDRPQAGSDAHGSLMVTGAIRLAAGAKITLVDLNSYPFSVGQRFVVARSGGAASYDPATLVYSAVGYTGGKVVGQAVADDANATVTDLKVTLTAPDQVTTTPRDSSTDKPAHAALDGLFHYPGVNPELLDVFNSAAALASAADANRAGAQLSPAALMQSTARASSDVTVAASRVADAHLDELRGADAGEPASGGGLAGGDYRQGAALWGRFFGGRMTQDRRDEVSGYHAHYRGLALGGDIAAAPGWRPGVMFSYVDTSVADDDFNSGSSASVMSAGLTGYVGYSAASGYINASAGMSLQRYATTRLLRYPGFAGSADGRFGGRQYTASVQAGYRLAPGGVIALTPVAGLLYASTQQSAFTETGGNGAALKVGATTLASLKSDIGARLDGSFETSLGPLAPSLQARWRHEFRDPRVVTEASFAADRTGASAFQAPAAAPGRNTGVLMFGATLLRERAVSVAANYSLEAAPGYKSHSGDIQVRWQF